MFKRKIEQYKMFLIEKGIEPNSYVSMINVLYRKTGGDLENQEKVNMAILDNNYSASTQNSFIKAMKKWCECFDLNIKLPSYRKEIKKLPHYIEEEFLLKELIPYLHKIFPKFDKKVKALLLFLFYTGIRKSELMNLKRSDIDLINCKAKIYEQKKKKERFVYFPKKIVNSLVEYFNSESEKENAFNINRGRLDYIFEQLKINFPKYKQLLKPHAFRHSFAVHCLRKDIPLPILKSLMGHTNIETTMIYLELQNETMERIYREKVEV